MFNRFSETSLGLKVFGTLGTFLYSWSHMQRLIGSILGLEYILCATMILGVPISNIEDLFFTKGKMAPRIEND